MTNSTLLCVVIIAVMLVKPSLPQNTAKLPQPNKLVQISSKRVPGCPDLEAFQQTSPLSLESLGASQLTRIACLCGPGHSSVDAAFEGGDDSLVSVTCIYGSTTTDLMESLALVQRANKAVQRIMLDHMDFANGSDIVERLLQWDMSRLEHLEIKKCRDSALRLANDENDDSTNTTTTQTFGALEALEIEECEMEQMPSALLSRCPSLKSLSVANNKISALRREEMSAIRGLETLNLAGNLLSSSIEKGSLSALEQLRNLEIGDHNYASEALLWEIGRLANLESLDLSQMDGVDSTEHFAHFRNMSRLKRLVMTGCNLKALNASSFVQFPSLEWLDLRVNLIEQVEAGCFVGLQKVQFLSLAGNFLRELPSPLWRDLPSLENLDLGWNEFRRLNKSSFDGIGTKLARLNLRNNEALREIGPGTLDQMARLQYLNLSGASLDTVSDGLLNLPQLVELDISSAKVSAIGSHAFDAFKSSLEWLSLARNALRALDERLLSAMPALKAIDLSDNKWLCDEKMQKVAQQINDAYKSAAVQKREFELRESAKTVCDRPFAHRGESIFDLLGKSASELAYSERLDTTTTAPASTTPSGQLREGLLFGDENSTIDWRAITLLVGSGANEHLNFTELLRQNGAEDALKPKYDINAVKYGQRSVVRNEANTWLSGVIVTLLIIVTAFCIVIVARRKKDGNKEGNELAEAKATRGKKREQRVRQPIAAAENSGCAITSF